MMNVDHPLANSKLSRTMSSTGYIALPESLIVPVLKSLLFTPNGELTTPYREYKFRGTPIFQTETSWQSNKNHLLEPKTHYNYTFVWKGAIILFGWEFFHNIVTSQVWASRNTHMASAWPAKNPRTWTLALFYHLCFELFAHFWEKMNGVSHLNTPQWGGEPRP